MRIDHELLTINFTKGRHSKYPVDCITIHVTEGLANSVRSWFRNPIAKVSSHYMVTRSGQIVQFVREEDTAWANGRVSTPTAAIVKERHPSNPNGWTISIEHEGTGKEDLTPAQRASSVWLIRDIVRRRPNIGINRRQILRHQEIYALKTCPGVISVDRLVKEASATPICL